MPLINAHDDVFSKVRGLHFGLSLHLKPYFVHASSEEAGKYTQTGLNLAARQCDKYQNLVYIATEYIYYKLEITFMKHSINV